MEYTEHVLDRSTGELRPNSLGDWITITELGALYGVTPLRVRAILRKMDFLYVTGGHVHNRHRLSPWAIQQGLGKHIPARKPKVRFPFDVIGPAGREWIAERWSNTVKALQAEPSRPLVAAAREALQSFRERRVRDDLGVRGCVLWLADRFPGLTHTEMASILDVSQQLVSRNVSIQRAQRDAAKLAITQPLPDLLKRRLSVQFSEDAMPSGGYRYITQDHNTAENAVHPFGHLPTWAAL